MAEVGRAIEYFGRPIINTLDNDEAKKQEIAELRNIFGQPPANNDQQNQDD